MASIEERLRAMEQRQGRIDKLLDLTHRGKSAMKSGVPFAAFDSTGNSLGEAIAIKAGSSVTITKSGIHFVLDTGAAARGVVCAINGGGAAVPAGTQAYFTLPRNVTVTGWDLVCDTVDTFTFDVQKTTYANFPAGFATIWTTKPSVAAAQKNQARGLSIAGSQYDIWLFTITAGVPVSKLISLAVYENMA